MHGRAARVHEIRGHDRPVRPERGGRGPRHPPSLQDRKIQPGAERDARLRPERRRPGARREGRSSTRRAFGYPVRSLRDIPAGEYFVQAWLNVYTTFKRERRQGRQAPPGPGRRPELAPLARKPLLSEPVKVTIEAGKSATVPIRLEQGRAAHQALRRHRSGSSTSASRAALLTEFWGQPMFIGANVLLPKGYDEHPGVRYPVHYVQGHFPRGRAGRFSEDETSPAFKLWTADDAPRFIQVTLRARLPLLRRFLRREFGQRRALRRRHHRRELIPHIEKTFRAIGEPWARVLSGRVDGRLDLAGPAGLLSRTSSAASGRSTPTRSISASTRSSTSTRTRTPITSTASGRACRGAGRRETDGNLIYTDGAGEPLRGGDRRPVPVGRPVGHLERGLRAGGRGRLSEALLGPA